MIRELKPAAWGRRPVIVLVGLMMAFGAYGRQMPSE